MSVQSMLIPLMETPHLKPRETLKVLLVGLFFILVSTFILEVEFLTNQAAQLEVGGISPQDIVAPATISYESKIATERAQDQAAKLIQDVYGRPDPNVAREQRVVANQVFNYLDAVRVDPYLTLDQKLDHILAVTPVSFTSDEAVDLLNLDEALWTHAKQEVDAILDRVLRNEIKETDLPGVRYRLGLNVSPEVPDDEARVIIYIAEDLIQPNTFVDEVRTNEKRQQAREAVKPVLRTFEKNEIVARNNERVDELTIEALQAMGLHQPARPWHDFISTFLWLLILVAAMGYYLVKYHLDILQDNQRLAILVVMPLIFMAAIRTMTPDQTVLAYALPMAALTITLAGAFDPRLAIVVTLLMGLVEGYAAGWSFELAVYVIIAGLVVGLNVRYMAPVNTLLRAGLYAAASNMAVIIFFRFAENDRAFLNPNTLLTILGQLGSGILGGLVSAGLALVAFLVIGNLTGVITHIQLIELSRPTHTLLAELLRRAPGTYHHSLLVSNLAEQAAIRIGANALLCRVGAYYHDVGKMIRPYFFAENTRAGVSLHDNLDPETSVQVIISHVTDGVRLAKQHRLPPTLCAFIAEHHGTEVVNYFYQQALQAADGDASRVNKARYAYPGPKPQSRETAILMLADSSEAAVRSVQPETAEEIDKIIRQIIAGRAKSGQFDECDLTMRDLEQIRVAFNEVLQGVSHQRVKYPDQVKEEAKVDAGPLPALPLALQHTALTPTGEHDPTVAAAKMPLLRD